MGEGVGTPWERLHAQVMDPPGHPQPRAGVLPAPLPGQHPPPLRGGRPRRSPTGQPRRQVTPLCAEGRLVSPARVQGTSAGTSLAFRPRVPKETTERGSPGPCPSGNHLLRSGTRLSVSLPVPGPPSTVSSQRPGRGPRWPRGGGGPAAGLQTAASHTGRVCDPEPAAGWQRVPGSASRRALRFPASWERDD